MFSRYFTYAELVDAVDNKMPELERLFKHVSCNVDNGEGFLINFLKKIMDDSLLYRLYTPKAKGVR